MESTANVLPAEESISPAARRIVAGHPKEMRTLILALEAKAGKCIRKLEKRDFEARCSKEKFRRPFCLREGKTGRVV